MLSLGELSVVALLSPAVAALCASVLGHPWPRNPGLWARWVVRVGLLLGLGDIVWLLYQIQPVGSVEVTLWKLDQSVPVTLQVDLTGAAIAIAVLVAALVVSFSTADRRPLASAALGLAALGGVMAAFSGGLLSLFVGLELSAVGGIGLSYARSPRAASPRIVWAAMADQTVALGWLGAVIWILRDAGTLQFADLPTRVLNPALAAVLLVPAAVRLGTAVLLTGGAASAGEGDLRRNHDIGDWLAVVAIPTALILLFRVQQLGGGVWPGASFGTVLDCVGVLFAAAALALALLAAPGSLGIRAMLLATAGLVFLGFGADSPAGLELGIGAGLFMILLASFLPRALSSPVERGSPVRFGWPPLGARLQLWAGVLAALLPVSFGITVALVGLSVVIRSGVVEGLAPAVGYLVVIAVLSVLVARMGALLRAPAGREWALLVPVAGLFAAAVAPGWVLTSVAGAIASDGGTAATIVTAPDPLAVQIPGLLWPAGYLTLLMLLGGLALFALRVAAGLPALPRRSVRELEVTPALAGWAAIPLIGAPPPVLLRLRSGLGRAYRVTVAALELSEREVAERPVWLWLATTLALTWLLTQR
jgi:hypothetical protein